MAGILCSLEKIPDFELSKILQSENFVSRMIKMLEEEFANPL